MFGNTFKNKKIIVTGHTGFKGSWLTMWLLKLGAKVYGISKDIPTQPSLFETLNLADRIYHNFQDIRDLGAVTKIFSEIQPEFVFHLAAQPIVAASYEDPVDTLTSNVIGTAHILEALRLLNNRCNAVIITSDKCYKNVEWFWGYKETDTLGGKDPYSASKAAAELIVSTYFHSFFSDPGSKIKIASVRAGNVIGGGDWAASRIVPDCIRAWSENLPVHLRNPESTRPWQHVLEPISGYLRTGQVLASQESDINGEAYNFGPAVDQGYTVRQLLNRIAAYWPIRQADFFKLEPGQKFKEAGLLKLNCEKSLNDLDWKPVLDFEQTARFTSEWYAKFYFKENLHNMNSVTDHQVDDYVKTASEKGLAWTQ